MGAYLKWSGGSLFFDVVTSEGHNLPNTITEHPVESGADITDHVRPALDKVSLEGFISNTPVFASEGKQDSVTLDTPDPPVPISLNGAIDAIGSLISPKKEVVANVMGFTNAPDFVAQTIAVLKQLRNQATLITVVCPSQVYENMLLEEIEVSRDPGTGTGASFNLELKEIRTVASSITQAPEPAVQRGKNNVQKGSQEAETPGTKKQSLLTVIGDKLGI